jgi:hypothetical protein
VPSGCATAHTTFAVTGPSNTVGQVDRRFDAEKVDITMERGTDFEAEMVPDMRDDITRRLGQMLDAPRGSEAAPPTKVRIKPLPGRGRTFDVSFETQVGEKTVTTSGVTPDLSEPGLEGASFAVGLGGGIGYGCGLAGILVGGVIAGPIGAFVMCVVAVLLPTGGIGVSYLIGQSAEKAATARAGAFMGELLAEHARKVQRATRDHPAGAPPASAGSRAPTTGDAAVGPLEWYVAVDGAQQGPFAVNQVRAMVDANTITPDTLVWKKGMPEWIPLAKVPELKPVAKPPPLPPSTPPPAPPSKGPPPLPTATKPGDPPPLPK